MLSMLISIESILYILFLEKYFFLKFYQYSPYHGGRRRHTAAMGPHPRQQSTQQSTNIICDGSTSLKLETKLFITSNITINACRIDVDK